MPTKKSKLKIEAPAPKPKEAKAEVVAEDKSEKQDPPKEIPPVKKPQAREIPQAVPASSMASHETAIAKKTAVKFVAGWRHLKQGVPFTAPKEVIVALRKAGFVE